MTVSAQIAQYVSEGSRTIAAQVVYFRLFRKMTQEQLAAASDMDQPTIARLEKTADIHWAMPTLAKIASALDMRVSTDLIPTVGEGHSDQEAENGKA